MDSIKTWEAALSALGLSLKTMIAGAVGAFVSLNFFNGLTLWERWMTFMGGWAMASWAAEPLVIFFDQKPNIVTGVALLLGLLGMSLAAASIKAIRETDWIGLAKTALRLIRGGNDNGDVSK